MGKKTMSADYEKAAERIEMKLASGILGGLDTAAKEFLALGMMRTLRKFAYRHGYHQALADAEPDWRDVSSYALAFKAGYDRGVEDARGQRCASANPDMPEIPSPNEGEGELRSSPVTSDMPEMEFAQWIVRYAEGMGYRGFLIERDGDQFDFILICQNNCTRTILGEICGDPNDPRLADSENQMKTNGVETRVFLLGDVEYVKNILPHF